MCVWEGVRRRGDGSVSVKGVESVMGDGRWAKGVAAAVGDGRAHAKILKPGQGALVPSLARIKAPKLRPASSFPGLDTRDDVCLEPVGI